MFDLTWKPGDIVNVQNGKILKRLEQLPKDTVERAQYFTYLGFSHQFQYGCDLTNVDGWNSDIRTVPKILILERVEAAKTEHNYRYYAGKPGISIDDNFRKGDGAIIWRVRLDLFAYASTLPNLFNNLAGGFSFQTTEYMKEQVLFKERIPESRKLEVA